jgi:hypothetical protein
MNNLNDRSIPDECPACGKGRFERGALQACIHPYHLETRGNYGEMISREETGAVAGGQADPLVQEPDDE